MNRVGFSEASSSCLWWDSDMQWHLKPFWQETRRRKFTATQHHENQQQTNSLNADSPHLCIAFDTFDNTTSTSGALWILSGWLSPWERGNLTFPSRPDITLVKDPKLDKSGSSSPQHDATQWTSAANVVSACYASYHREKCLKPRDNNCRIHAPRTLRILLNSTLWSSTS